MSILETNTYQRCIMTLARVSVTRIPTKYSFSIAVSIKGIGFLNVLIPILIKWSGFFNSWYKAWYQEHDYKTLNISLDIETCILNIKFRTFRPKHMLDVINVWPTQKYWQQGSLLYLTLKIVLIKGGVAQFQYCDNKSSWLWHLKDIS